MTIIEFEQVHKTYNPGLFKKKIRALHDLNLAIREGEVFGLIGPNGAGKSTTIRLLLGLSRPSGGEIRFRCRPLGEVQLQREIGYLPENPYLYDHLSLLELLAFGARVSGLEAAEGSRRARELLGRLGLEAAAPRPLRTYSKGMLQRAGLCFALLQDPPVVILDEPMSGLDPLGRRMVFDLVREMRSRGKTVFFCSHILSDVERLCDRIGLLSGGELIQVYERGDFAAEPGRDIHLVVAGLDSGQRRQLQELGILVSESEAKLVLTTGGERLADLVDLLRQWDVPVEATRGERLSLEALFLRQCGKATP